MMLKARVLSPSNPTGGTGEDAGLKACEGKLGEWSRRAGFSPNPAFHQIWKGRVLNGHLSMRLVFAETHLAEVSNAFRYRFVLGAVRAPACDDCGAGSYIKS